MAWLFVFASRTPVLTTAECSRQFLVGSTSVRIGTRITV